MGKTRGNKDIGYLTPDNPPQERLCRSFSIPNDPTWLGVFMGALMALNDPASWIQHGTQTPDEAAAEFQRIFDDAFYGTSACALVPAPYWDDATDNEVEMSEDTQIWYGTVADWLAPIDQLSFTENVAVWALTGFVAYAAGVGAAIFFRTTAKQFVIALEGQDVGELIRIIVDSAEYSVNTTGMSGQIINQTMVGDPNLTEHDIYVIKGVLP